MAIVGGREGFRKQTGRKGKRDPGRRMQHSGVEVKKSLQCVPGHILTRRSGRRKLLLKRVPLLLPHANKRTNDTLHAGIFLCGLAKGEPQPRLVSQKATPLITHKTHAHERGSRETRRRRPPFPHTHTHTHTQKIRGKILARNTKY